MDRIDETNRIAKTANSFAASSSDPTVTPNVANLVPGTIIDSRYQIESLIGQGGCGCVYKIKHVGLQKYCALKTLNPVNVSETTILRFHKEAKAASLLEHDNLVRATDFGMIDNFQPFLVMDYVEGPTLADYLKQNNGYVSVKTTVALFIQVCSGLAFAHQHGVIHRDIKPSNILLATADNELGFIPKVSDFGIAKLQIGGDVTSTLTTTGQIFGTPLYMSPEQCMGSGVDQRSDIYSLGCVLFEVLTASPPFVGSNALELMMKHTTEAAPSLKEGSLGREFPTALETIVANMLNKDPKERYQRLEDTVKDLVALSSGKDATSLKRSTESSVSRAALIAVLSTMAVILVGCISYYCGIKSVPLSSASIQPQPSQFQPLLQPFYSQEKQDKVVFEFPADLDLGDFHYWDNGPSAITKPCKKTVVVPKDAKLMLNVDGSTVRDPSVWAKFRNTDLSGVRISFDAGTDSEEAALTEILPKESLRMLVFFPFVSFKKQTWNLLGIMPNLRCLEIGDCLLDDEKIRGRDFLRLGNLCDLKVLELVSIVEPAPLLSKLTESKALVRFALLEATLSPQDGKRLAQIPNLKSLALRICTITDSAFFDELAKAPKLEDLCLSNMIVRDPNVVTKLKQLKHLKRLAFDSGQPLLNGLRVPGCQVIELGTAMDSRVINAVTRSFGDNEHQVQNLLKTKDTMIKQYLAKTRGYSDDSHKILAVVPENPPEHEFVTWFDFFKENPDKSDLW
jgi:serine/threonine protein kinase